MNDLNFKPWTKDGFTLTSWLRLNSDQGLASNSFEQQQHSQNNQTEDTDNDNENENEKSNIESIAGVCSQHCLCKNKQHFISIGTNSLILSIYLCVTNVNTMYFQLSNPSAQSNKEKITKSHSEHFRCNDLAMANGTKKPKCTCTTPITKKRRSSKKDSQFHHENIRLNRKPRSKENRRNKDSNEDQSSSTSNVLSQTINTTRMALKSSLSHFSLFSSNRQNDKDIESHVFGYPIEVKGVKLHKNRWTLFSLFACSVDNEIQIQIFIDNSPAYQVNIPCSHLTNDSKKDKISVMCIGHKNSPATTPSPTRTKDFSTLEMPPDIIAQNDMESQSFRYSLSNVLLFRKRALNREILAHLYSLGPDCVNFAQCQVRNHIHSL